MVIQGLDVDMLSAGRNIYIMQGYHTKDEHAKSTKLDIIF